MRTPATVTCARCGTSLRDKTKRHRSKFTQLFYCNAIDACGRRTKRRKVATA